MPRSLICAGLAALIACSTVTVQAADEWHPAPNTIMTQWTQKVDPAHPLPEYPRPQMVRKEWTNLNGLWDYTITDKDAQKPEKWDGKILVPFCVESSLSGVKKPLSKDQRLWYRRTFAAPADLKNQTLLLHFGAVDWEATVWVNGQQVATHKGGYDPFSCNVTHALKEGGENELVVSVWDPTGDNGAPHGKQRFAAIAKPGGIFYTPCSGIWQTVWMEPVPERNVGNLRITPDVDKGEVELTVTPGIGRKADSDKPVKFHYVVTDDGQSVADGDAESTAHIKVPNAKLWSPESPHLYDLKVNLEGDEVTSYFAMRKVSMGKDDKGVLRPMLNNKPIFMSGPLDQGFWPDGIYTAPTDDALKFDIDMTKKFGFNCTRKHVKVEPDRWYYWCDKLGLIVWQDMPSGGVAPNLRRGAKKDGVASSPEKARQFEDELKAMIDHLRNHPSICVWVIFNEGWGQYDTPRIAKWVKEYDPTRIEDAVTGWEDQGVGDMHDMHHYPAPATYKPEESRIAVLGEFGGLGLPIPGHQWVVSAKNWGYQNMAGNEALTGKYIDLWREVWRLRKEEGMSAAIYTQITDVETESNGLMSYDRKVIKIDPAKSAAAVAKGEFPPPTAPAK